MRSAGQVERDADGKLTMMRGIVRMSRTETSTAIIAGQRADAVRITAYRHIGSWSMELATGCISWSDEMYQILWRYTGHIRHFCKSLS